MKKSFLFIVSVLTLFLFTNGSCDQKPSAQKQGEKVQETVMQRALAAEPTPQIDYFLTRKAVVKWMERMDQPNKLFYIYVLADNGAHIGYFIAQYRPVSTATFLTPTKRLYRSSYGVALTPSNALDGTYYGSGGAADQYFFFDAETDAFIELKGLNYILMDQPLSGINVPRLKVETK